MREHDIALYKTSSKTVISDPLGFFLPWKKNLYDLLFLKKIFGSLTSFRKVNVLMFFSSSESINSLLFSKAI